MSDWQLAQLNIAQMLAPADSPQLAEFFDNLERINALADRAPGFVWRLESDPGSAISTYLFGESALVNMSVWEDAESLHDYVYRSAHAEIMAKRRQWFAHLREAYSVLWWVPAGTVPTLQEARARLQRLQSEGPSAAAFTFKRAFPPPGHPAKPDAAPRTDLDGRCPSP